ncbi:RING-H2 finger protein ATL54 [Apostasia shenzhenica]|uniref:RING-H2 finger protein ATL54 n=1 Tax=Apostasia shenzhenica TaxID=1088818 RepID=A0A2I0APR1_9ASPA|nr:RING-H2 finger protein ATL54 [Apostasia shenzhenica]
MLMCLELDPLSSRAGGRGRGRGGEGEGEREVHRPPCATMTANSYAEDGDFIPSSAPNNGVFSPSLGSGLTQAVPFSSGNPRIEETRGIMHLFTEDSSSPKNLPADRKPLVCVLAVPNHMTYADFCMFCASFVQHMLEMRIVRNGGMEDQYSVLIRFDDQSSTDGFFVHFNGKRFSSLEVDACRVLYASDVQYTGSIEHAQGSLVSSAEQTNCPVCLERLDQDDSAILTTICNHSFHCSCISKWTDSSCPVCRYCQQQPEKSTCSVCGTSESLWICLICGSVGCGRYKEGHAIRHWKETQHCYSLELETQRVWDYVGDNYVHRLIQSKTDGKLVEFNFHCSHADDTCGTCDCIADCGSSEALFNSKVKTIVEEYNDLLTSQLENQRKYFESLLQEAKEEAEREISEAIEKAVNMRLQKLNAKLDKCVEEKRFFNEINENLLKNREIWNTKIQHMEKREQAAIRLRDAKVNNLEEQLQDLIIHIEGQNSMDNLPSSISTDVDDSTALAGFSPSSLSSSSEGAHSRPANRGRRRS